MVDDTGSDNDSLGKKQRKSNNDISFSNNTVANSRKSKMNDKYDLDLTKEFSSNSKRGQGKENGNKKKSKYAYE